MRTLRADRHMLSVEWVTVQVLESHSMLGADAEDDEGAAPATLALLDAYFDGRLIEMGVDSAMVFLETCGLRRLVV